MSSRAAREFPAIAEPASAAAANADRRVVERAVGRRRVKHDPGEERSTIGEPIAPETPAVGDVSRRDGSGARRADLVNCDRAGGEHIAIVRATFRGFAALPPPQASADWRTVLRLSGSQAETASSTLNSKRRPSTIISTLSGASSFGAGVGFVGSMAAKILAGVSRFDMEVSPKVRAAGVLMRAGRPERKTG